MTPAYYKKKALAVLQALLAATLVGEDSHRKKFSQRVDKYQLPFQSDDWFRSATTA